MGNARIKELETKLAESEENNKLLEMQLQDMERSKLSWENQYFTLYNTLKNYREVLAEKEKEIEEVKQKQIYYYKFGENCKKVTIKTIDGKSFDVYNNGYEDKIEFAVNQLEKVLVLIHNAVNIDSPEYDLVGLYDAVSNQIKQLKEMK